MAADQRRKRLHGASILGCSPREQRRMRRSMGMTRTNLSMKSHISVEWDGHQKKVVSKREQIGISWRNMSPFVNTPHHAHNALADVLSVPADIFELDSLKDVLSYQTWKVYLTEIERNHLSQLLPRGLEPDQVVQELLNGENLHFGNPFLEWSDSLCSGVLHPDAILLQEHRLQSYKKLHYSELHRYHSDMVKLLMEVKERWESCNNPEKDILQNLCGSRNEEKWVSSHINEFRLSDPKEDVPSSSGSGSWDVDERACSSDYQISSLSKGEKPTKRILEKENVRGKRRTLLSNLFDPLDIESRPMKGDKLRKRNIGSEGVNYLSYIKISKRQLELVQSMKKAGQSIQVKSLDHILGNLDGLHVQPYEVFVEEEQKNRHDHWLHLVNEDIPSAHKVWRERQMQIVRMKNLMEEEILIKNEKTVSSRSGDHPEDYEDLHEEGIKGGDAVGSRPDSLENHYSTETSSPSSGDDFDPMNLNPEKKKEMSGSENPQLTNTKCSSNLSGLDNPCCQEMPSSSGDTVWKSDGMPNVDPQINEQQQSQLIDLETDLCEKESDKELLLGHSADDSFRSCADKEQSDMLQSHHKQKHLPKSPKEQKQMLQPYREQNNSFQSHHRQNGILEEHGHLVHSHQKQHDLLGTQPYQADLLHSFLKGPGMLPHLEQMSSGLNSRTHNSLSHHLLEQISDCVHADESRYLLPRQGHLSSVTVPDWAVTGVRMTTRSQSQLSREEYLGNRLFPADQVRWTGSEGSSLPSQCIDSGAGTDQSLYSVLSQCNQLRPTSAYNPGRPADLFLTPRTSYGLLDTIPLTMNPSMQQPSTALDFLSEHGAANSLVPDDMTWMSLPPQNPALHDHMGKPFPRDR